MIVVIRFLQIFLHPVFFIFLILLVGTILTLKFGKRPGKILLCVGLALLYLLSISPIADLLICPLEAKYQPIDKVPEKPVKVIVVLSGARMRIIEAVRLYHLLQGKAKIFVSGGSGNPFSKLKSAKLMAELAQDLSVPEGDIAWETRSRDTFENAKETKKFVGDKPFILVTSASHMPRAIKAFHYLGLNPIPAPCDYQRKPGYDFFAFVPSYSELKKSALAINEYAGMVWYALTLRHKGG